MPSQKISQFTTQSLLSGTDLFTLVRNGTNLNISYSDLKLDLGVTGSLSQAGDPLGAPVLDVNGDAYSIRNLEDGAGVSFSISAENGVVAKWNVSQDTTGFPITSGLNNKTPVISSLIASDGISIAQGTDSLILSATGEVTPTNTVVINQESDFPIQDATTITLSAKTRYVIGSAISSAKRFICEDGFVFTGENILGVTYTYTGTGDMFSSTLAGGTIQDVSLSAPNASQGLNMSDTSNTKLLFLRNVRFLEVPKFGTFDGFLTTIITLSSSVNSDDGLTLSGSGGLISNIDGFAILSSSATCTQVDLTTAVIANIEYNDFILVAPSGGVQLKGAANSANVPAGALATFTNASVSGGATDQLSGITVDDIRWDFKGNSNIADSISDGLVHTESNTLETVISVAGTPVRVNAVFIDDDISKFASDGLGRLTFIGEVTTRLPIDASATLLAAAGGDKQLGVCIAINGSPVSATCAQGTASSSKAASITTIWQHDFKQNDYVEAFVLNGSGTDNVIVQQAIIRVN